MSCWCGSPSAPLCSTGPARQLAAAFLCSARLWRGGGRLWVAGPIISPWISLRRVSARLKEAGCARAELWPTYSAHLWLSVQQYARSHIKIYCSILTYIFEKPYWIVEEYSQSWKHDNGGLPRYDSVWKKCKKNPSIHHTLFRPAKWSKSYW